MKKAKVILFGIITLVGLAIGVCFLLINNKSNSIDQQSHIDSVYISTIIVPHHDFVREQRAKVLQEISAKTNPQTIILVSPNHFSAGSGDIITTDKTWELFNNQLFSDKEKINQLVQTELVSNEETAFSREHGITNLLAEIVNNFPQVKLLPLIFRQNMSKERIEQLADRIYQICPKDCLLIASVDFSHYQPGALAEIHDDLSIRALNNLDEDLIMQAEVDSPQSLLLAMLWAKSNRTEQFVLKENTNSGKISNERDSETTSYVFGYYRQGDKKEIDDSITFTLAGDMMFDRFIDYKFPGEKLPEVVKNLGERLFWGVDVAMINMEGPISATPIAPNIAANNLVFDFPPKTTDVLKWLHINTVSLANNHTNNAGASGLENTKKVLREKNINYIGQQSVFDANSVKRFSNGNQKMTIIAVNLLENNDDLAAVIKKEKQDGAFVLVFPHWGNEYEKTHSDAQQKTARDWIDAGADLIIGSHPHVVQDAEIYQGKPIFYSLGNLLFDQTFSEATQQGLVLAGAIKDNKLEKIIILPTVQKNLKPELMRGQDKTDIISKFRKDLGLEIFNYDYGYDIIGSK